MTYTTQLQAGLGLVDETRMLLELWQPGATSSRLYEAALASGRFPGVTARRLKNIVKEGFAPRYLVNGGAPAQHLKLLSAKLPTGELLQFFFIFTARAQTIFGDFVRDIYWERYATGASTLGNADALAFIQRALDDGKTVKRWSDITIKRVSGYLTSCCADFGLLEKASKPTRRIQAMQMAETTAIYLAYDLHLQGLSDAGVLGHPDWQLFGLKRNEVLEMLKRLGRKGQLIVQSGGDVTRISWKYDSLQELCNDLA